MADSNFLGLGTNIWGHDVPGLVPPGTESFATDYSSVIIPGMDLFSYPKLPEVHFELPQMGDEPLVQTFFEGPKKCTCCINWVERQPVEIPKEAQEKYEKAAIRIYKCKDHHGHDANGPKPCVVGGLTAITISYIEIQSPIIRREVGPILTEGGLETLSTETIKVSRPFKELYFAHGRILDILKRQEPGTKEKGHMQVLVDVLEEIFAEVMPEVSSLHAEKKITFNYLWTIFPKNIIVFSNETGQDWLYEVVSMEGGSVKCRYVEFDGMTFGWSTTTILIKEFTGIRKISSLPVYPIGFHTDEGLEERLVARGRKVLEYQDIVHCDYQELSSSRFSGKIYGTERVVIDVFAHRKYGNYDNFKLEKLQDEEELNCAQEQNETEIEDAENGIKLAQRPSVKQQGENKTRIQKRRQWLLLLSPMLRGFSFTKNTWRSFYVDSLGPISWNAEALERLVFPESHKDLILAFVTNYGQSIAHSDDVIDGKGHGLVILLSGPPGTGKTSTVEAIAEKTKRPLYRVGAQDTHAGSLSETLSYASTLAKEYGAVLLLDEADVFLHRRSAERSVSNEIVAEMLRELEYYVGIIFLTTNLLHDLDYAFLSRIHMHFKYPSLTAASRLKIWNDVLLRMPKTSTIGELRRPSNSLGTGKSGRNHSRVDISDDDLNALASWKLNGREIKNVVKVARLWCQYNNYPLTKNRLETVIDTTAPAVGKEDTTSDEASSRKRTRTE